MDEDDRIDLGPDPRGRVGWVNAATYQLNTLNDPYFAQGAGQEAAQGYTAPAQPGSGTFVSYAAAPAYSQVAEETQASAVYSPVGDAFGSAASRMPESEADYSPVGDAFAQAAVGIPQTDYEPEPEEYSPVDGASFAAAVPWMGEPPVYYAPDRALVAHRDDRTVVRPNIANRSRERAMRDRLVPAINTGSKEGAERPQRTQQSKPQPKPRSLMSDVAGYLRKQRNPVQGGSSRPQGVVPPQQPHKKHEEKKNKMRTK